MIMKNSYKSDLIERLTDMTEQERRRFQDCTGKTISDVLEDSDDIEALWYSYQKNITEYDCDEDFSFYDALNERYGGAIFNV